MRSSVLIAAAATVGVSVAVGVTVAVASCGSDGNSASTTVQRHRGQAVIGPASTLPASTRPASSDSANSNSPKASLRMAAASRESATGRTFGSACAKIPATGAGSRRGMASVPVVTAVSHNPLLTDLAHAAGVAGLTTTLNSASALTLFAPDNSAFRALGKGNYKTLMAHRADLAKVLKYQVVRGRITPAELAERKSLTTLAGLRVHPLRSRNVYRVNSARVICGNLHAANATIYIVNEVFVPTS